MTQLRDIKARIESVQKTKKMTQAMKMVAAAKFKRASNRAINARPYLSQLKSILSMVLSQTSDAESPFLNDNNATTHAVVVITSDRGLCGGFNTNVMKKAEAFLNEQVDPIALFLFGTKGYQHFKSGKWDIAGHYENVDTSPDLVYITELFSQIVDGFVDGTYGKVTLIFNEFVSAVSTNLLVEQVLPFHCEETEDVVKADYIFDPSSSVLFDNLARDCVQLSVYRAFLESIASEQGARMAAMDAATSNAGDMVKQLKLIYNRQRQAQITTELSEIVAGAEALAG